MSRFSRSNLLPARGDVTAVGAATLVLLTVGVVFGGASRQHELRLLLVQLAALPLLVLAVGRIASLPETRPSPLAFGVLALALALPLMQLIPLPPVLWTGFPGRDQAELALTLADLSPGWSPLSLNPEKTWRSWLALIPPIAAFLGVLAMRSQESRRLMILLLTLTAFSVMLGALQLASGSDDFYLWRTTDPGNVTGFFANRNHFATLCVIAIPFAAAFWARTIRRRGGRPASPLAAWLPLLLIAATVVAVIVSRSRAGAALLTLALGGGVILAVVGTGIRRPTAPVLIAGGVVLLTLLAGAIFGLGPLLERFDAAGAAEGRFENWPIVAAAANDYLPLGSGFGTFDAIYRSVEPLARLDSTYFNQAHNDYLETWLEAGWLGAVALVLFLVWFARRTWTAWIGSVSTAGDLQRAASVAIGLVLSHSLVDYPLRTETILVVFAVSCALLEQARFSTPASSGREGSARR